MATSNFITVLDLKNNTVIQNNIEPKLLEPFIEVSQDINIVNILGEPLAIAMLSDMTILNGITEATANRFKTLLAFVKPAHIYCTAAEATPFLAVRITNKGFNKRSSEFSGPASETEVKGLRAIFANYADNYKKKLECFLLNNEEDYPEFREANECQDNCKTERHQYFSGFQFDKSKEINPDIL